MYKRQTINNTILAEATDGIAATNGVKAVNTETSKFGNYSGTINMGAGGNGAVPPSGGGCVTIICKQLVINNNGKINTNGKSFTSGNGNVSQDLVKQTFINNMGADFFVLSPNSQGGKGGTFISTAGEIKVYEGVDE